jgi:hypothetical protein
MGKKKLILFLIGEGLGLEQAETVNQTKEKKTKNPTQKSKTKQRMQHNSTRKKEFTLRLHFQMEVPSRKKNHA